eukprot:312863_1
MVIPTMIITGAAGGIGRGIAIAVASMKCYKLALIDIKKCDETIKLCQGVNEFIEIKQYKIDVSNSNALKSTIQQINNEFSPIACLVNNAALIYLNEINSNTIDLSQVNNILDVNLKAAIHCTSYCVPYIKQTKKKYPNFKCAIIILCSRTSTPRKLGKGEGVYASTKWGLMGFTECLFEELCEDGIKVCAILPGWTNTDQPRKYNLNKINWNLCVQPSDVGQAVKYILNCSDTVCPFKLCLWPQRNPEKSKL